MGTNLYFSIRSSVRELLLRGASILSFTLLVGLYFSLSLAYAVDISTCTVIDAPGTYTLTTDIDNSTATRCIEINSSNVTLDGGGYTIDGEDTSRTYGVYADGQTERLTNVVIKNLKLTGWYDAIYYRRVDNGAIESATITNNTYRGIYFLDADLNSITQSTVNTNNFFGIYLSAGSSENTISENTVNDQGQGIQANSGNNIIRDNRISFNKYGIDVASAGSLTIENNRITYNWYAIFLYGSSGNTISGNIITDNGYEGEYAGIYLAYSENSLIYNNKFDNYQNFKFYGTSGSGNTWNVSKQAGPNVLGGPYIAGNYWGGYYGWGSAHRCTDDDGDYVCENSYLLAPGNIDNFPIREFRDRDSDGVEDSEDNCRDIPNANQANSDSDDLGDACDNCWNTENDDQADTNDSCPVPPYTVDPQCGDACEPSDTDGDDVIDIDDNCPFTSNQDQSDIDDDGRGDVCDNCISVVNADQTDSDGDGLGNACDNCWYTPNLDHTDSDSDCSGDLQPYTSNPHCGDACDECPSDPDKRYQGICGCGVPETDTDNDGTPDCIDGCPEDRGKTEPGSCGCKVPDTDEDSDGQVDCNDNCPTANNPDQADADGDGVGDICDSCPDVSNRDNQEDSDDDGVGDVCDNCLDAPNGRNQGVCTDGHPSIIGNSCVASTYCNTLGVEGYCSKSQEDTDGDGSGDACDTDDDNDSILDASDNCPIKGNGPLAGTCILDHHGDDCMNDLECGTGSCSKNQEDSDGDGIGDACNDATDKEGDEWADALDNCPDFFNPDQLDSDNSGIGDICEFDLSIRAVEISQGIQDMNNDMFTISGKDTFIRVHLDIGTARTPLDPVSARLRFTNQSGQQIPTYGPGSPAGFLFPVNNRIRAEVIPDRGDVNHTFNFLISERWFWFEQPYITIQVINESPHQEIDQGAFSGNNYYGPVPWEHDFLGVKRNVKFVPVRNNNCTPTLAEFYRAAAYVEKTYPISRIDVWEDEVLVFDDDPTVTSDNLMFKLWERDFWSTEEEDNTHYYGLVCDYGTIGATGRARGTGGAAEIINNQDIAWGLMEKKSPFGGATMAHELYHNLFAGLAGGDHHVEACSNPTGINQNFPRYFDENGAPHPRGSIGEFGFTWETVYCSDSFHNTEDECTDADKIWFPGGYSGFKVYQPDRYFDFMTYCPSRVRWVSPYTYRSLIYELDYLTIIGGTSSPQRVVSATENQEYLATAGIVNLENNTVSLKPFFKKEFPKGSHDHTGAGPYSVELVDSNNNTLFQRNFDLDLSHAEDNEALFSEILPYAPETSRIIVRHNSDVLETVVVSASPPEVTLTFPNGGETLRDEQVITWDAQDADGDALYFTILYSIDGGDKWSAIATGIEQTDYVWDTDKTEGSDSALIRIIACDGVNCAQDDSESTFTVVRKIPQPVIITPQDGATYFSGKVILFNGNAFDTEDGPLPEDQLNWSSDISASMGSGRNLALSNLSAGNHVITLMAEDSDANRASTTVNITILADSDADGDQTGDAQDNCPSSYNPDQADADNDGDGDVCDNDDSDSDGFPDNVDNCRSIPNDNADEDGDGIGDMCDNCPNDPVNDADNDGICDGADGPDTGPGDDPVDGPGNCFISILQGLTH